MTGDSHIETDGGTDASNDPVPGSDVGVGDLLGFGEEIDPVEEGSRPFGAKLALLVVAVTGTVLGVAGGVSVTPGFLAAPGAVLGGLVAARAARAVAGEDNLRRARGSVGVVAGTGLLVGSVAAAGVAGGSAGVAVVAATGLATAIVGVGALVGVERPPVDHLRRTVRRSGTVLAVATLASALAFTGALWPPLASLASGAVSAVSVTAFGAFVALQVLAVAVVGLLWVAVPFLDEWVSRPERDGGLLEAWQRNGVDLEDVPRAYWGVLLVQVLLGLIPTVHGVVGAALASVPVLGPLVGLVLVSGVLHAPLAAIAALAALTILARGVQVVVVAWAGHDPPRALSYAAGALALSALAAPASLRIVGDLLVRGIELAVPGGAVPGVVATIGPAATLLGAGALVLGITYFLLALAPLVAVAARLPERSGTFAAGATLVFGAGAATVVAGAHAVLAFVATVAALLVWDLGENAAGLVEQVGPDVDVRDAETTHAAGSLLVGAVGVALATAAYYLLGWLSVPVPSTGAGGFMAMVLALVALIAFANLALGDGDR